jgi:hypothetical protein
MKHATLKLGEYEIPLIGLAEDCVNEICDMCKFQFHIQNIECIDDKILCFKCKEIYGKQRKDNQVSS